MPFPFSEDGRRSAKEGALGAAAGSKSQAGTAELLQLPSGCPAGGGAHGRNAPAKAGLRARQNGGDLNRRAFRAAGMQPGRRLLHSFRHTAAAPAGEKMYL